MNEVETLKKKIEEKNCRVASARVGGAQVTSARVASALLSFVFIFLQQLVE